MIFPLPEIEIVDSENLDEKMQVAKWTEERIEEVLGF